MRTLALSLPETAEGSHFGQPDFRVRGKIFAGLSRDEARGTLKLTPEAQGMLLDANPTAVFPAAGAWGDKGWTHVQLADVQVRELEELVNQAWRLTAPKGIVIAATGDSTARAPAERRRRKTSPAKSAKPPRRRIAKTSPSRGPA
jgi:hypothetical protein